MNRYSQILIIALPVLVGVVIVGSLFISFAYQDPYWLNRGGALIAALSALAILPQIVHELHIDKQIRELEGASRRVGRSSALSPREELTEYLLSVRFTKRRLRIAAIVVGGAFFGELLHGFGDVVLKVLFTFPATH